MESACPAHSLPVLTTEGSEADALCARTAHQTSATRSPVASDADVTLVGMNPLRIVRPKSTEQYMQVCAMASKKGLFLEGTRFFYYEEGNPKSNGKFRRICIAFVMDRVTKTIRLGAAVFRRDKPGETITRAELRATAVARLAGRCIVVGGPIAGKQRRHESWSSFQARSSCEYSKKRAEFDSFFAESDPWLRKHSVQLHEQYQAQRERRLRAFLRQVIAESGVKGNHRLPDAAKEDCGVLTFYLGGLAPQTTSDCCHKSAAGSCVSGKSVEID